MLHGILIFLLCVVLFQPILTLGIGIFLLTKKVEIGEIVHWWFKSTFHFFIGIPLIIVGLPLVAIGLFFKREFPETTKQFTDVRFANNGNWHLVRLPTWLLPWDNSIDGMLGDRRGWWDNYCREHYKKPCTAFYSMWQWAAIRNSTNYYSRIMSGCDVSKFTVSRLAGQDLADENNPGWSFLVAKNKTTDEKFHVFQVFLPYSFDKTHGIFGKFGWKMKMKQNGMSPDAPIHERIVGGIYRCSPWKGI